MDIRCGGSRVGGSDTHYASGEEICAGDKVRCGDWTGVVVVVLTDGSATTGFDSAEWSYLGRGFLVEYVHAGLVFSNTAEPDLTLVARA